MPIYKDPNQVPQELRKLIYIQSNIQKDGYELSKRIAAGNYQIDDLSIFTDLQLIHLLRNFQEHRQNKITSDQDIVVTTDNYLKMCYIYLRAISKVPVIIMGETGCGKTSLIRFFCQNILNDSLEIFNIHAGITSKIIFENMSIYIN
jgi:Cdc6-like AAA superfamily ATPase